MLRLSHSFFDTLRRDAIIVDGWVTWYRLTTHKEGFAIPALMNWSLYDGLGGLWIAAAAHAQWCESAEWVADRLEERFLVEFESSERCSQEPLLGGYSGPGGLAYSAIVACQLKAPKEQVRIQQTVCKLLSTAKSKVPDDREFDMMSGAAGLILNTYACYRAGVLVRDDSERIIEACVAHLASKATCDQTGRWGWPESSSMRVLGGMSHGYLGIALALEAASKIGVQNRHTADILSAEAVSAQRGLVEADGTLRDLRDPSMGGTEVTRGSWCHGTDGVALAAAVAWSDIGPSLFNETTSGNKVLHASVPPGWSMCHGATGHLAALFAAGDIVQAKTLLRSLSHRLSADSWNVAFSDYGMMTGITGAMITLYDPHLAIRLLTLQ